MNLSRLDTHHKVLLSIAAAAAAALLSFQQVTPAVQFIICWIAAAATYLCFSLITVFTVHPIEMKKMTRMQDSSRTLIFLFVLAAALVSLFVVLLLLRTTSGMKQAALTLHIVLSIAAVTCSWLLVHTLFLFRYAHLYYTGRPETRKESKYTEGLDFPDEKEPDYLDFAYFSFVIGMTFQVSDVEISSRHIRRLALLHSLISFVFNTVIVALSINVISGLMAK